MTDIIQHSSQTNDHYTPIEYVEAVRELFDGNIDLDPATAREVNEKTIRAKNICTIDDDGLSKEWHGSVYLNPPGGIINRRSSMFIWYNKLVSEYQAGRVNQAIFLGFNLEILKTSQSEDSKAWIGSFPICFPKQRISFWDKNFKPQKSPSHPNLLAYLPKDNESIEKFVNIFSKFGAIK